MKFTDKCPQCGRAFENYWPEGYQRWCSVGCMADGQPLDPQSQRVMDAYMNERKPTAAETLARHNFPPRSREEQDANLAANLDAIDDERKGEG